MPLTDDHEPTTCTCDRCRSFCRRRSCWPTPEEAQAIIDAGHGDKLMLDWWVATPTIYLLCGAIAGYEGKAAPADPRGRCGFLTADEQCELHPDLKPIEGRLAYHDGRDLSWLHGEVAAAWDTPLGRSIVKSWSEERGIDLDAAAKDLDIFSAMSILFDM